MRDRDDMNEDLDDEDPENPDPSDMDTDDEPDEEDYSQIQRNPGWVVLTVVLLIITLTAILRWLRFQ